MVLLKVEHYGGRKQGQVALEYAQSGILDLGKFRERNDAFSFERWYFNLYCLDFNLRDCTKLLQEEAALM